MEGEAPAGLPLVVAVGCNAEEAPALAETALLKHVSGTEADSCLVGAAAVVIVRGLARLAPAVLCRLRSQQLILCLGAWDKKLESALAAEAQLRLIHVDVSRADEAADAIMASILHLNRGLQKAADRGLPRDGVIAIAGQRLRRMKGLRLGLVGFNEAAAALARRAEAFGMKTALVDFNQRLMDKDDEAPAQDSLLKLVADSDVLSLHCSLTTATRGLLDAKTIACLKPGAILVNTSGVDLVEEGALKRAIGQGHLHGCVLQGADSPGWQEAWIREMDSLLLLPANADESQEVWRSLWSKGVLVAQAYLQSGKLPGELVLDENRLEAGLTVDGKGTLCAVSTVVSKFPSDASAVEDYSVDLISTRVLRDPVLCSGTLIIRDEATSRVDKRGEDGGEQPRQKVVHFETEMPTALDASPSALESASGEEALSLLTGPVGRAVAHDQISEDFWEAVTLGKGISVELSSSKEEVNTRSDVSVSSDEAHCLRPRSSLSSAPSQESEGSPSNDSNKLLEMENLQPPYSMLGVGDFLIDDGFTAAEFMRVAKLGRAQAEASALQETVKKDEKTSEGSNSSSYCTACSDIEGETPESKSSSQQTTTMQPEDSSQQKDGKQPFTALVPEHSDISPRVKPVTQTQALKSGGEWKPKVLRRARSVGRLVTTVLSKAKMSPDRQVGRNSRQSRSAEGPTALKPITTIGLACHNMHSVAFQEQFVAQRQRSTGGRWVLKTKPALDGNKKERFDSARGQSLGVR